MDKRNLAAAANLLSLLEPEDLQKVNNHMRRMIQQRNK